MTLIVTDGKNIYTDTMQSTRGSPGTVSYTQRKVRRIDDTTIVAISGAGISDAELYFLKALAPQLNLDGDKPPGLTMVNRVLGQCSRMLRNINLTKDDSMVHMWIIGQRYMVALWMLGESKNHICRIHNLANGFEQPMAMGSGYQVFITEYQHTKNVIGAMKEAIAQEATCGGDIIKYSLKGKVDVSNCA